MTIKNRLILFIVCLVLSLVFLLPTIKKDLVPTKWVSRPISLGLDLSGGAQLLFEVDTVEALRSRLQTLGNTIKSKLREDKISAVKAKGVGDALEIYFVTDEASEKAKAKIAVTDKDLVFVGKGVSGSLVSLIYKFSKQDVDRVNAESINQAVEVLRNRVDQFGISEPIINRVGSDKVSLQMPGVTDTESIKKIVGSVAALEFRLVPATTQGVGLASFKNREGEQIKLEDDILMSGDSVADAKVDISSGQVAVDLVLTSEGARTFKRITAENIGRQLAIVLDGIVYSDPVIREAIGGGRANISGSFTLEQARQLAIVLRAGALPAPLKIVEERKVGPSLGAESIRRGIIAILGGLFMIGLFMVSYYKKSGVIAIVTLVLNLLFCTALLSMFGATLTLPGLAGLALTVGMAVDSNVIIFERIKEEIRNGSNGDFAVKGGFNKALSAIWDSNLTTFISGSILYIFGTGPIRGFAVTLGIGIITTVFSAIFCAKLLFDLFLPKNSKGTLSI